MSGVMRHGYALSREITTVERRKGGQDLKRLPRINALGSRHSPRQHWCIKRMAMPAPLESMRHPLQGDGAGLDHVVRCRRLRAIGERRIRAGVVTIRLPQRGWRHHQAEGDRVGWRQIEN